jgi:hypothetical protein
VRVLTGSAVPDARPEWLGWLDVPVSGEVVAGQVVLVSGWALLGGRAPSLVEVLLDGQPPMRARTRMPRPDVAEVYLGYEDATVSGYLARVPVDVPPGTERELTVRIRCRTEGVGEWTSPETRFAVRNPAADPEDAQLAETLARETATGLARVSVPTDPRHLLVFTHSLAIGGAELWLQELLARLVTEHGWRASVVTETDGPLRADCAKLGVPVHETGHYRSGTVAGYEGHVAELARYARCSGAGVALVNTLGAFVAADAAKRAGLPAAWALHESFTLPDFAHLNWGPATPPAAVWARWHSALAEVDRLVFVADATRELFLPYSKPERCRTIRYGSPLWTLGGRIAPEVREQARADLGYEPDDLVLVTVGLVDPRKGVRAAAQRDRAGSGAAPAGPVVRGRDAPVAVRPRARRDGPPGRVGRGGPAGAGSARSAALARGRGPVREQLGHRVVAPVDSRSGLLRGSGRRHRRVRRPGDDHRRGDRLAVRAQRRGRPGRRAAAGSGHQPGRPA